ncbi:response regulator [Streptomyces pathocidini]|uniref:Response regulator n=1 Tax=Streptomyces pathocidini TaxID=1650571 RepID=A0ABW7UME9_9ACTN
MPGATGRVLVVDDNKVIRQLIRVNLELEGFEVVTAADGAECLEIVHGVRPDVITLDVVMPRLDGLRTAARLNADPRTRPIPVAIISACTQPELDTGYAAGVSTFLAKPFEPGDLVRLVRRLAGCDAAMPTLPSGPLRDPAVPGAGATLRDPAVPGVALRDTPAAPAGRVVRGTGTVGGAPGPAVRPAG